MKPKFKGNIFALTIAVFILLVFLHSLDLLNPLEKAAFNLFSPIQKILYDAGVRSGIFLKNIAKAADKTETDLLKAQIRSLLFQNAKLKILADENKILKKELGFDREYKYNMVASTVIGRDSLQNSTLLLLRIENTPTNLKDIKMDMPVIAEDGILVGKIASIKNNQVFMLPLTASHSAVAATVLNKNYTIGVAEGELNLGIKMRMIPKSEEIKQGDLIVTSGLEKNMPKGLLIGTVSKIAHDSQNPFNIAHISPLYDLKRLSSVLIIKNY